MTTRRLCALLLGTTLALAALLAWRELGRPAGGFGGAGETVDLSPLADPDVRAEVVRGLVAASPDVWDTFPDHDVGRLLQPGLAGREAPTMTIASNSYGMRELPYALPKPAGTTRVVLLGDSFVFGQHVEADERLGVFLEEALRARVPELAGEGALEVLHLGIAGWNLEAECAWVRRQLGLLQPDLVVHVTYHNDIGDSRTARGFGAMASFTTQRDPSTIVSEAWPGFLGFQRRGYVTHGLDHESRARFAAAAADVERLAGLVEAQGGRYLMLVHWRMFNPVARERLVGGLRDDQVVYLPLAFDQDPENRISAADGHWSVAGHRRLAALLYGLIRGRDLLAGHTLPEWPAAAEEVERLVAPGLADAGRDVSVLIEGLDIGARVVFPVTGAAMAAQVHSGLDAEGRVAPYASFLLAGGGSTLRLTGRVPPRPELAGTTVEVRVEGEVVGAFSLTPGEGLDHAFEVPAELAGRAFVTVSLAADDHAYAGDDLRGQVVFELGALALD